MLITAEGWILFLLPKYRCRNTADCLKTATNARARSCSPLLCPAWQSVSLRERERERETFEGSHFQNMSATMRTLRLLLCVALSEFPRSLYIYSPLESRERESLPARSIARLLTLVMSVWGILRCYDSLYARVSFCRERELPRFMFRIYLVTSIRARGDPWEPIKLIRSHSFVRESRNTRCCFISLQYNSSMLCILRTTPASAATLRWKYQ